jgi:oxygen-independent coproporphyrinogen-3 oxidase
MNCQVTRTSLGVQDISPDVQALINRHQPILVVRSAVERLRDAGIAAINLDLMYGLPGQTVQHVKRAAEAAADLMPNRLTVFGYAHVPWFKRHQRAIDESRLPDTAERMAQAKAAADYLQQAGFVAIGIDHFARPDDLLAVAQKNGKLFRNFQGYTVDAATSLIGFGASSIGSFAGGYVQNEPHLGRFRSAIAEGRLAVVRGVATRREDRLRRAIIERLMCDFSADIPNIRSKFDFDGAILSDSLTRLGPLQTDGLVAVDDEIVRVTPLGRPFVRNIAACFDTYIVDAGTRHSLTV